jgi:hypothetical protein
MWPNWVRRWCTADLLLGVTIFIGAATLWPLTSEFGQIGRYQVLGPSFWPRILLIGLLGLSALTIGQSIQRSVRSSAAPAPVGRQPYRLLAAIGLCFGYVAILPWLGFTVGTCAFAVVFLLSMGASRPSVILWTSLVLTGSLFILFITILNAPLPPGQGVFLDITRFLTSVVP